MRLCNMALLLLVASLSALEAGRARAETIPLKAEHGTYVVPVVVNERITLNFTLDSGAADVSIPKDVFSTLVRAGTIDKGDLLDVGEYELADGSVTTSRRFYIRSMRIGGVELRNVIASVAPAAGTLLLGQTFLSRLQSWSIDNQRHTLLINQTFVDGPSAATVDQTRTNGAQTAAQTAGTPTIIKPSDWVLLGKHNTIEFYVDRSSIQTVNEVHRGWFKIIYAPHTERGAMPGDEKKWVHILMYYAGVNCGQQLIREEQSIWYYDDGSWDSAPAAIMPTKWDSAPPDSLGDKEVKTLCVAGVN